jgi:archaellin
VANNLDVTLVSGTTLSQDPQGVQSVNVTVQLAPGSQPVNLSQTTVEIYPEGSTRTTVDTSNFDTTTLEEGGTAILEIPNADLGQTLGGSGNEGLLAGNEAEIVITTGDGSQVTDTFSAPDTITSNEEIILS